MTKGICSYKERTVNISAGLLQNITGNPIEQAFRPFQYAWGRYSGSKRQQEAVFSISLFSSPFLIKTNGDVKTGHQHGQIRHQQSLRMAAMTK